MTPDSIAELKKRSFKDGFASGIKKQKLHEQAAVEAEREACAKAVNQAMEMVHDPYQYPRMAEDVIRARGPRSALDEMLAEAEKRGHKRGLGENLSRSQEKRLSHQLRKESK